jgi:hypothetical protein
MKSLRSRRWSGTAVPHGARCGAVSPRAGPRTSLAHHPGNEEPPAKRAGLQFHDVKQRNFGCRLCAGAGCAPLNNTSHFRGAWAPRFDPFAAAPTEGLRSADKAHSTSRSRRQDATATFARRGRTLRGCARLSALRMAIFGAGPLCISGVAAGSVARVARGRESRPASGVPSLPSRRSLPPSRTPLPLRLQDRLRRRPSSSRMGES